MTRLKALKLAFAAVFAFPAVAFAFPWSLDMWVQPSVDPYEKPVLYPQNSVSKTTGEKMTREQIEAVRKSPVEPSGQSIERGKQLYAHNCVSCHGGKGLGDGIIIMKGHGFYPVNLAAPATIARTDGYIYAYIMYGGKVMMPAYSENMPMKEDAWHIVNYVRHLQKPSAVGKKQQEKQNERN